MSDQLILTKSGAPFKTVGAARMFFAKKKYDETEYAITQVEGGWAIGSKKPPEPESVPQIFSTSPEVYDSDGEDVEVEEARLDPKGYSIVVIAPAGPGDIKKVPLTLNGVCIRCSRNMQLPLPNTYVEILRHAVEIQHRKADEMDDEYYEEEVYRYPHQVVRPATKAEFDKMFKKAKKRKKRR